MGLLQTLSGMVSRTTPEERFWQWFEENADRLREVSPDSVGILDEVGTHIGKVSKGLTFEIGMGEPREFVVSADGIRTVFPAVRKLVDAAPEIPGWKITAFRPRKGMGSKVQLGDVEVGPESICFAAEPGGPRVGLTLYCKGWSDESKRRAIATGAFILLDHALGEYDVETKIGSIDWEDLPDHPESHGLRPFEELPTAVDEMTVRPQN